MHKTIKKIKQSAILLACTTSLTAYAFGGGGGGAGGTDDASTVYGETGPHAVTVEALGSGCTLFRPSTLSSGHAAIIWANGFNSNPSKHDLGLRHWASHGFIVSATNGYDATGAGAYGCLAALENASIASHIDFAKVAATGHSLGGAATLSLGRDSRIATTAPIQPGTSGAIVLLGYSTAWPSQQISDMLLLGGSEDTVTPPSSNQNNVFAAANVDVFYAIAQGASHDEGSDDHGVFRGITTAWFKYKLSGDSEAAALFQSSNCSLCNVPGNWEVQQKGAP